jgi:hypothetical protein
MNAMRSSTFGMQSLQGTAFLYQRVQANSRQPSASEVPLDQIDWSLDDSIPNKNDNLKEQSRKPSWMYLHYKRTDGRSVMAICTVYSSTMEAWMPDFYHFFVYKLM